MVSKIQSILFSVESWTKAQAMRWLNSHNYKYDKCFEARHYYHFSQLEPTFKHYFDKVISVNNGLPSIVFVMGSNDGSVRGGGIGDWIQDELGPLLNPFGLKTERQEAAEQEAARQAADAADTAKAAARVAKFQAMSQSDTEKQLMSYKAIVDNAKPNTSAKASSINALNRWMAVAFQKYPMYFTPEYFKSVGLVKQDYLPYKNGNYLKFADLGLGSLDKYMGSGRRRIRR